jgi:hypothetical protein
VSLSSVWQVLSFSTVPDPLILIPITNQAVNSFKESTAVPVYSLRPACIPPRHLLPACLLPPHLQQQEEEQQQEEAAREELATVWRHGCRNATTVEDSAEVAVSNNLKTSAQVDVHDAHETAGTLQSSKYHTRHTSGGGLLRNLAKERQL